MSNAKCAFVRISSGTLSEIFSYGLSASNEVILIVAENSEKINIISIKLL